MRVRRGSANYATCGTGSFTPDTNPVETLAELQLPTATNLVAAAGTKVWDVTAGGEEDTTEGTGFTNARWQTAADERRARDGERRGRAADIRRLDARRP